jgi:hypothetical protein
MSVWFPKPLVKNPSNQDESNQNRHSIYKIHNIAKQL